MKSHIVINIDNCFLPQAAAFAASVFTNGGLEEPPVFHVLSNGVSEENEKTLTDFIVEKGGTARFYDLGDFGTVLAGKFGAEADTGSFPVVVMARIFAAEYLPDDVERYLYMDTDMIVRGAIAELFNVNLGNKICAACPEPSIYEELPVAQGNGHRAYFNSGLLLVDRRKWDELDITGECVRWYTDNNGKAAFPDQDLLNHVLAGRILPLPQKFNFFSNYHYQKYTELTARNLWYGELESSESYESAKDNPAVVHFAGGERPWLRGNKNPYREEYKKYLSMTPWKDEPETGGKEAYLAFYHTINVLSEAVPGFRTLTSRIYHKTGGRKS